MLDCVQTVKPTKYNPSASKTCIGYSWFGYRHCNLRITAISYSKIK